MYRNNRKVKDLSNHTKCVISETEKVIEIQVCVVKMYMKVFKLKNRFQRCVNKQYDKT